MATKDDFEKTGAAAQLHKIRITLTSRNVANLEKCESTSRLSLGRCTVADALRSLR